MSSGVPKHCGTHSAICSGVPLPTMPDTPSVVPKIASAMPAQPQVSSSLTIGKVSPVGSAKKLDIASLEYRPMLAASWMTGQGVSSFSSYSAATGRITFSAKSWTHFCICSWSSLRSSEKSAIAGSLLASVPSASRAIGTRRKLPVSNPMIPARGPHKPRATECSRRRKPVRAFAAPRGTMGRAAGPRPLGRGRRPGDAGHRLLQPAPRRHRRAGRSQRRRQDHDAQGHRRRGPARRRDRARGPRRSATSPRTLAPGAWASTPPASRTCSPGRGFDQAVLRLEKLRLRIEENPTDRDIARFAKAEEQFRDDGGYRPSPRSARSRPGSASTTVASTCRSTRSPAVSVAGSSSRASCSPAATCSCSTSRPTTSTTTPSSGS